MTETITFGVDGSVTFKGRELKPLSKKLNPIWWVINEAEQTVDEAPWYLPDRPYAWRWMIWNVFRNPLQNFRAFVVGVADRNYTVQVTEGDPVALVVQRNDVGELGWQKAKLRFPERSISLMGQL